MSWRLARSLEVLRGEIDRAWPGRDTASDGTIGDAAHRAGWESSDHNPWISDARGVGVVRAVDITHDPSGGPDCDELAEHLRDLGAAGDTRVDYVIWNRRITSATPKPGHPPWTWRPYSGSNPHDRHLHLSVSTRPAGYDATRGWGIEGGIGDVSPPEIWQHKLRRVPHSKRKERIAGWLLRWAYGHAKIARREAHEASVAATKAAAASGANHATLEALTRTVGKLAGGSPVDLEGLVAEVRQASEDGARAALADGVVEVDIRVRDADADEDAEDAEDTEEATT